ncbi:hypothetical protein NQZ68_014176 [Dissostichus eleginoides]|nr:hypothetical protein NQZ68_014176 [Dissostichus eleginoides]
MGELRRLLDKDNSYSIDEMKERWQDFCQKVQFYGVWKKMLKPPLGMDKVAERSTNKTERQEATSRRENRGSNKPTEQEKLNIQEGRGGLAVTGRGGTVRRIITSGSSKGK